MWESWIYSHVEGGIEFVFTDEFNGYDYDFAPIPTIYTPMAHKAVFGKVPNQGTRRVSRAGLSRSQSQRRGRCTCLRI